VRGVGGARAEAARGLAAALVVAGAAACGGGERGGRDRGGAAGGVEVRGAWARPTAGPNAAAYLTVVNHGDAVVTVVAARTPAAAAATLHESVTAAGAAHPTAHMVPLAQVGVAPGDSAAFAPGGRHLMLERLRAPIAAGQRVPLTLVLATGEELRTEVEVRAPEARPRGAGRPVRAAGCAASVHQRGPGRHRHAQADERGAAAPRAGDGVGAEQRDEQPDRDVQEVPGGEGSSACAASAAAGPKASVAAAPAPASSAVPVLKASARRVDMPPCTSTPNDPSSRGTSCSATASAVNAPPPVAERWRSMKRAVDQVVQAVAADVSGGGATGRGAACACAGRRGRGARAAVQRPLESANTAAPAATSAGTASGPPARAAAAYPSGTSWNSAAPASAPPPRTRAAATPAHRSGPSASAAR
jgi:copper(I)-binding protein